MAKRASRSKARSGSRPAMSLASSRGSKGAPEPARVGRRVMASAPLSDEARKALWAQFIESRSATLRARLIECYLRLAHVAAGKFFRMRTDHAVSFSDYLQYARLGLVEAID